MGNRTLDLYFLSTIYSAFSCMGKRFLFLQVLFAIIGRRTTDDLFKTTIKIG